MLRLRTLGGLDLRTVDDQAVDGLLTRPKHLGLFIYLVTARPRGYHRRESLLALFWPEADQTHARNALNQSLTRIRSSLGDGVIEARGKEEVRIGPGTVECDATEFDDAVAGGDHGRATALYGGPFLPGFHLNGADGFCYWLETERRRLQALAAESGRSLALTCLHTGDVVGAEQFAARSLELGLASEATVAELMEAFSAAGDRVGALRLYRAWSQELARDLELRPSRTLEDLAGRIRDAIRAVDNGEPAGARPAEGEALFHETGSAAGPKEAGRAAGRRARWHAPAIVLAVAISAGLTWLALPARTTLTSVAVLPAVNLSADPDQDYLTEGIHDAVIAELARTEAVHVVSRTSVQRFRNSTESIPSIARTLDVDAVVEMAVLREGDRVSVTAQLIDGRTDRHLWSEVFERDMTDLLSLRKEIAWHIARGLRVSLSREAEQGLRAIDAVDPRAYDLYLRGIYHLERLNPDHTARALVSLERAVTLDSTFAMAWGALALAHGCRGMWIGGNEEPAITVPAAERAAGRALALDSEVAEAYFARGYTAGYYHWRWDEAERMFRTGLALNPDHVLGRVLFANFLIWMGRFPEAEAVAREGTLIAPLSALAANELAASLYWQGKPEAIEVAAASLDLDPDFPQTLMLGAEVYVTRLGRVEEGIAMAERLLRILPEDPDALWYAARAFAAAGDTVRARELQQQLEQRPNELYTPPGLLLEMSLTRGDSEEALHHLQRAFDARDPRLIMLKIKAPTPVFAPIRADPIFTTIMDRLAFPG